VSLETYAVTAGPSSRSGERPGSGTGPEARDEPGPVADPSAPSATGGPGPAPGPGASGPPDGPPQDPAATRALHPGERPPPPPNPVGEIR
jgi:hypothetical protein